MAAKQIVGGDNWPYVFWRHLLDKAGIFRHLLILCVSNHLDNNIYPFQEEIERMQARNERIEADANRIQNEINQLEAERARQNNGNGSRGNNN